MADIDSYLPDADKADGTVGVAIPTTATLVGGKDGSGLLQPLLLDSSQRLTVSPLTNTSVVKAQLQDNGGTAITVGQKVMASSIPVALSSDQSTIPISAASLPLPAGASTSALQNTGNTSLSSIDSKLTSPLTVTGPLTNTQIRATPLPISGTVTAIGNIASGQADSGNPIKVGGVYNTSLPTVTNGQRVDLQLDSNGRLLTSTAFTTTLPAASFSNQRVITNGVTIYTSYTASQRLAIKQFYAGGTGIGKQILYSYAPSNTLLINAGDFETAGNITSWPYFSSGGSGTGSVALSTTQAFTGTHSAAVTFTNSDANRSNGLKQIFSTPLDISAWRYITAEFFNTVSAGAAYTRTISIVITDSNANTRKYDLSGLSTNSPFNASNWIKISGEILNPTSFTGTTFDSTSIASIELRMVDSATRAGTIYWDTARLESQITTIFPIYHNQNTSFNIAIDPVFVMEIGDQILIAQTNNDTSKQEYFALAGGVSI